MHVDDFEELTVDGLGRLGRRLAILHQRPALFQKLRPPAFPRLIERSIREDFIEKNLLRQLLGPWEFRPRLHGEIEILY